MDLKDAVLSLQVCSGFNVSGLSPAKADVSNDARIGLEEAVYALRVVAGLVSDGNGIVDVINQYRRDNGLSEIPVSPSLMTVAQAHVMDLEENHPDTGECNTHSWSDKGDWIPCCYTPDHANKGCMWSKPSELTDYSGRGYENAAMTSGQMAPDSALEQWKRDAPYRDMILNTGTTWSKLEWRAIGGAVSEHYAVVWFGEEADAENALVTLTLQDFIDRF